MTEYRTNHEYYACESNQRNNTLYCPPFKGTKFLMITVKGQVIALEKEIKKTEDELNGDKNYRSIILANNNVLFCPPFDTESFEHLSRP